MTMNELQGFLVWSVCIHYGFLLLWLGIFVLAHDWLYRLHSRWFRLSVETFDAIHYGGMAAYKLALLMLNLVPLVALILVR